MNGKCPACKQLIYTVNIGDVKAAFLGGNTYKAVSYSCQACGTVISIQIDPIAVRSEIVSQTTAAVLKALGKAG